MRGLNPKVLADGKTVWHARLFAYAAVVPVGTYDSPIEAINAVRNKANVEWSLGFSDPELFWKNKRVRIRGVIFSSLDQENPWEVFVTEDRQRFPVGFYPDLLSAIEARDHAELVVGQDHYRDLFERNIEQRVQERFDAYKADLDRKEAEKLAEQRRRKYTRKKSPTNSSGVTGVCRHKASKKWQAYINVDNRRKTLGLFENFEDAVAARLQAEVSVIKGES